MIQLASEALDGDIAHKKEPDFGSIATLGIVAVLELFTESASRLFTDRVRGVRMVDTIADLIYIRGRRIGGRAEHAWYRK